MAREITETLHAGTIDSDLEDEYMTFEKMEEAMNAAGYSKAFIKINPQSDYDITSMMREIKDKFAGFSVQIFVKDTGREVYILVTSRKKEHNINKMQNNLDLCVKKISAVHQGYPNYVESRPIESREFK